MKHIYVKEVGQGIPLILIHGFGFHSGIWRSLLSRLTEHYRVTLIDLPGWGNSPWDKERSNLNDWINAIAKVTPNHAVWLGWSLGGLVCMQMALTHPQRVMKLITVATSPKFVADGDWPGLELPNLENFKQTLINDYSRTIERFLSLQLQGAKQFKHHWQILKELCSLHPLPHLSALQQSLRILEHTDLRTACADIHMPWLQILGTEDRLVPVSIAENRYAPPNSVTRLITDATHVPFITHKNQFMQTIIQFCNTA